MLYEASSLEEDQTSNDCQFRCVNCPSKLPVLEKEKFDEVSKLPLNILSKMIGLETLYSVLSEEHLGLQLMLKETIKKLKKEETRRKEAENRLRNHNPINVALAERIQSLEESEIRLRRENKDLKEENDLLEFRVLEMEDHLPPKRTPVRTPDPGRFSDQREDILEVDDVSDSGVMSLPTSDDEHNDFNLEDTKSDEDHSKNMNIYGTYQETRCDRDVKTRLLHMCQAATTVSERISLQQALALLRHYEARIEGLESTIAAMCHEATMARSMVNSKNESFSEVESRSTGKIVATVLPFSEASTSFGKCDVENRKEFSENQVFDDHLVSSRGTQTENKKCQTADLTTELEKLTRIRERIETGAKPLQTPKDLTYYEKRIEALQSRLAVYESCDDERSKALRSVLQRSTLLTAQVSHLHEKISRLEKENIRLEEERSELEELENDTRLRCQRLETKLSALGEKKRSLKTQLEDLRREMTDRDNDQQDDKIEALVDLYEKKNQELEEREMEVRYRLQMLENTMPALMMWNIWRMMLSMQGGANFPPNAFSGISAPNVGSSFPMMAPLMTASETNKDLDDVFEDPSIETGREEDLVNKLKQLENKLNTQNKILADSKATEDTLRGKLHQLENWMVGGATPSLTTKDFDADVEIFDKLGRMAKDRMEMDKRIRDLELKEKVFKETLEQADNLIAQLENQFKSQISEKDMELSEATAKLKDSEFKLKTAEKNNRSSIVLHERIVHLENQVDDLRKSLANREREKERLENEESKLMKELEESTDELESMRNSYAEQARNLEGARKKNKHLKEELVAVESSKEAIEKKHSAEVSSLKTQLSQLQRDLMENDVTISELKEEVVTLESAVDELRYAFRLEKAKNEEMAKTFEAKIEMKERELEEANNLIKARNEGNVKSIFEELEEGCKNAVKPEIQWSYNPNEDGYFIKTQLSNAPVNWVNCGEIEPFGKQSKNEISTIGPHPQPQKKMVASSKMDSSTLSQFDFINMTTSQFRAFMTLIEDGEAQVDVVTAKEDPISSYLPYNTLPPDCKEALAAANEITSAEAKHTVEALTKAYNHSTICGDCNERLGSFLGDVVIKLGVRMPRIKTVALLQV